MATSKDSKIDVIGISGEENTLTGNTNINLTAKKGKSSDQHDNIKITLIDGSKNKISGASLNIVGVDYSESNANSASGAHSGQSATNVKTKETVHNEFPDLPDICRK
jgi:hypothetical protein